MGASGYTRRRCTSGWRGWLCLLALWLACTAAWAQPRLVVRLGYADQPFVPYLLGSGSQPADPPGSLVRQIQDSAAAVGVEVQLVRAPIARLLLSLERGSLDGIFPFSYTPQRVRWGVYPLDSHGELRGDLRMLHLAYYLYGHHDLSLTPNPDPWAQLAGYRLGAVKDTAVGEMLSWRGLPVELTRTSEQSLEKLVRGRIDLFVGPRQSTELVLAGLDPHKQIRRFGEPLLARDYYLIFHPTFYRDHTDLCWRWWLLLSEP
ncbi:MAG: hypothetical protein LRY38_00055 [Aeromonadaceae bacterium]|nr:hypothetical protein [Aeromonadaceae bacterium]